MTKTGTDSQAARLGATIKALREAHGLTVPQLAVAIGVTDRYLRYIESGRKKATPQVCRAVAGVLNIPLAAITVEAYSQIVEAAS